MKQKVKGLGKRSAALAISGALSLSFLAGGIASALGGKQLSLANAASARNISVDASKQYQEIEGWGATLAWWTNAMGGWTKPSADGRTQREYVMDLLYGKDGLDFNIARYNVGGGDDPSHDHMSFDRNMPGMKDSIDGNYSWENEDGTTKPWQETADANQIWALDWVQKNRDDAITEYFSNSPPYWMTTSGCASGNTDGSDNLHENEDGVNYFDEYVIYFLDVYEYLVSQGFHFDYVQPFNESTEGQWKEGGSQEGCDFAPDSKIEVLSLMVKAMQDRGIVNKGYNFSDEVSTGDATRVYNAVKNSSYVSSTGKTGEDIVKEAAKLTYHLYGFDFENMQQMYRNGVANGQMVEMSEVCYGGDKYGYKSEQDSNDISTTLDDMTTAFAYTHRINMCLKYGGANAFIYWQCIEDRLGQLKSGTSYGLLQGIYYDADTAAEWGYDLAAMGVSQQDVIPAKAYYGAGNYSKYIKAGYKIIECGGSDRTLAAISPEGDKIVIIEQNAFDEKVPVNYSIDGFHIDSIEKIVTDEKVNWGKSTISTNGDSFSDITSARSITTYVLTGRSLVGSAHYIDDAAFHRVNGFSDLAAIMPNVGDKETVYISGAWENNSNPAIGGKDDPDTNSTNYHRRGAEKQNYFGGTAVNSKRNGNTETYAAVRFYGTGIGILGKTGSDGANLDYWIDPVLSGGKLPSATGTGTTAGSGTHYRSVGFRVNGVNNLEKGWHTIYLKLGHDNDHGVSIDGFFVYESLDAASVTDNPEVEKASAVNGKLYVTYENLGAAFTGCSVYAEYRKLGDSAWTRSGEAATDRTFAITPAAAANSYEVRVVAVKNDVSYPSPAKTVIMKHTTEGLLYYVDCGTQIDADEFVGRKMGSCNSVYDQAYGADPATGLNWGYELGASASGTAFYRTYEEPLKSFASGDGFTSNKIVYKFTIPTAGTYKIALGLFVPESWNKSGSMNAKITGTGGTLATKNGIETPYVIPSVEVFEFATSAANDEITLTLERNGSDGHNPVVSLIVITSASAEEFPLTADTSSNYNPDVVPEFTRVDVKDSIDTQIKNAVVKVKMSNGNVEDCSVNGGQLTLENLKMSEAAPGGYAVATYRVGTSDMLVYKSFTLFSADAETYYNVDCNSDGSYYVLKEKMFAPGSLQVGGAFDQEYKSGKNTWGYTGRDDKYYSESANTGSVNVITSGKGYTFTGFPSNTQVKVTIGFYVYYGDRTGVVDIYVNSISTGNKVASEDLTLGTSIVTHFDTTTNGTELQILFQKDSGGGPLVAFITIEKKPAQEALGTPKADKEVYGYGETVTLSNLETGAMVQVWDGNYQYIDSFEVKTATQEWSNWGDIANREEISFMQVNKSNGAVSKALTVKAVSPKLEVSISNEYVSEEDMAIIRLIPDVGDAKIRSLVIETPHRVQVDVTDSLFYRTKFNGNYKAIVNVAGKEFEFPFEVKTIDNILLNATFSSDWTSEDLPITIKPTAVSGVEKVIVNGAPVSLTGGSYTFTVSENGTQNISVISKQGFRKDFVIEVENIDKVAPTIDLNVDFTAGNGMKVDYATDAIADGRLYVKVNGGAAQEIAPSQIFFATTDGKYEFYVQNALGTKSSVKTYYMTHGAENATLAEVKVNKKGEIKVSDGVTAKLYRIGEDAPLGSLNVKESGKYYLELSSSSGTEIVVLNTTQENELVWETSSTNGTNVALTVVFSVLAAAAVGGMVAIVMIKRRKAQ